jgi:ribonuclease-3
MADWAALEDALGVTFKDLALVQQAFIHRSYLNENPHFTLPSNERLEFFGDALLGFVAAWELYRKSPSLNEGEMTKIRAALVSGDNLAHLAASLKLGDYLYLSQGEEKSGGRSRQRNLACALEALIGAIFIDQGLAATSDFILRLFTSSMPEAMDERVTSDYKSDLQQLVQARQKRIPTYFVVGTTGPDHDKRFTVEVRVGDEVLGRGGGRSKQTAQKEAARQALETLYKSLSLEGRG